MRIVGTFIWHHRSADFSLHLQWLEPLMVSVPDIQAAFGDGLSLFHLRPKKGGDDIAWQKGGTDIHPTVLIHLATKKLTAIGALLTDDFATLDQSRVIDEQGAPFTRYDVLRLMKGEGGHVPDGTQWPPLVSGHDALSCILDHQQIVALGDVHNGVHLATHTGIVHGHDHFGLVRDRSLYPGLVDVQGIRPDIHEHRHCASQNEGVRRRDEGVGRHDHLISRLEVSQNGSHFRRSGAGVRGQGLASACPGFQPGMALLRKSPIPSQVPRGMGL